MEEFTHPELKFKLRLEKILSPVRGSMEAFNLVTAGLAMIALCSMSIIHVQG